MTTTPTKTTKRGFTYGYRKDKADPRDKVHNFKLTHLTATVPLVDLRPKCPPVYNQGTLGSCTANAIAAAYQFDEMKQSETAVFTPSRLFIYYNERVIENSVSEDSGGELRDGITSISTTGVCPETEWPYNIAEFTVKPPAACYTTALSHKAVSYARVTQILSQLQQCLINGYPFVFGFQVYASFESDAVAETGIVPLPVAGEECLGGHAVMAVGFDNSHSWFIVRNSWGADWGVGGYFYLPYAYVTNFSLCSDFWTVTTVADT